MEIEKIELLETLKAGQEQWLRGTVFDRKDSPFPSVIAAEVRAHLKGESRAIKVLMTRADVEEEEARIREAQTAKAKAEAEKAEAEAELVKREEEFQKLFKENAELKESQKDLLKENADLKKAYEEQAKKIAFLEGQAGELKGSQKPVKPASKNINKREK